MSEENTNETTDEPEPEPTKSELHERVEQLESTVAKLMPSRRDALRMGAAGLAGAAGLSATSQSADASVGSAGQIGDVNNRPDVFADSVDANQLTGVSTGGIKTKTRAFLSSISSADPIPFDSVTYDPDNNFDTNTHAYTVPADGTYQIALNVRVRSLSSGERADFNIERNGNNIAVMELTSGGNFETAHVTDVRELTSGDSIEGRNTKGISLNASEFNVFLTIIRLE